MYYSDKKKYLVILETSEHKKQKTNKRNFSSKKKI